MDVVSLKVLVESIERVDENVLEHREDEHLSVVGEQGEFLGGDRADPKEEVVVGGVEANLVVFGELLLWSSAVGAVRWILRLEGRKTKKGGGEVSLPTLQSASDGRNR